MLLASCAKDEAVVTSDEALVTFNVSAAEMGTRVYGDGVTAEDLHYAIYEKDSYAQPLISKELTGVFPGNVMSTSFTEKLVKGKTYVALFWADATNSPYEVDWNNQTVKITNPAALESQDENLDAFFKAHEIAVGQNAQTETIELRRPFAQLNIGTADTAAAKTAGLVVSQTEVSVRAYTTLNLLNGEVADAMMLTYAMNAIPTDPNATFTLNGKVYDHLSMNYLLVNQKELVTVNFTVNDGTNNINTATYSQVPVERNHKTFIVGELLTSDVNFEVKIIPDWMDPDYIVNYLSTPAAPTTADELESLTTTPVIGEINMTNDIDYTGQTMPQVRFTDSDVTINGNGNDLLSGDAGNYGLVAMSSDVELNDVNITSHGGAIGAIGGAQVTYNSGKVYVDSPSTSGRYIFYAEGEGSTITINGGEFSWDSADNQKRAYVYAGAGTTVYINGGTFGPASTRSGYTAGLLGSGDIIITGGTFGFDPSAWVAAGYQAVKSGTTWTVSAI